MLLTCDVVMCYFEYGTTYLVLLHTSTIVVYVSCCVMNDLEHLEPGVKDTGLGQSGRAWSLMHKARAMPNGGPKEQLLNLAVDSFYEHVRRNPNDWVATYDCGCALYDLAWASSSSRRCEPLNTNLSWCHELGLVLVNLNTNTFELVLVGEHKHQH